MWRGGCEEDQLTEAEASSAVLISVWITERGVMLIVRGNIEAAPWIPIILVIGL